MPKRQPGVSFLRDEFPVTRYSRHAEIARSWRSRNNRPDTAWRELQVVFCRRAVATTAGMKTTFLGTPTGRVTLEEL